MFLQALQFQQQQAALQQAQAYGTQFGYAPGGNWMQWGAGGPSQPLPGTSTLGAQNQWFNQAGQTAGMTGFFNNPQNWQYQPGTFVISDPAQGGSGAVGQILPNGQLQQLSGADAAAQGYKPELAARLPGANFQSMMIAQQGGGGMGQGQTQQTLQAQQAAAAMAAAQAQETGIYKTPTLTTQQWWDTLDRPTQAAYLTQNGGDLGKAMAAYAQVQAHPADQATLAMQQLYGQYGVPQQGQQTLQNIAQQNQIAQNWANVSGYMPTFDANGLPVAGAGGVGGAGGGTPTEQAREFNMTNALQQGQLGQQYLSTAAQLQGPQNTFQLSNYLRGAQGNPNVPVYLQNLANNIGMPAFQATGSTAPTTQSAAGLVGQMGGQTSATPGWDYNQTLGAIQNIMSGGAQKLGPGALERLSPDELQALGSGIGAAGGSMPSFLQQYQQSRVGQQAPIARTTLA